MAWSSSVATKFGGTAIVTHVSIITVSTTEAVVAAMAP
jgi:hypothetical protein